MSNRSDKITLYTETVIDSCHHLQNYNGKCANKHGHTWLLKVWIQGNDAQKDDVGILFDFGEIKKIQEELDHKYINEDVLYFTGPSPINPTAENISWYILGQLLRINFNLEYRVRLYETCVRKETYSQRQTDDFDTRYL